MATAPRVGFWSKLTWVAIVAIVLLDGATPLCAAPAGRGLALNPGASSAEAAMTLRQRFSSTVGSIRTAFRNRYYDPKGNLQLIPATIDGLAVGASVITGANQLISLTRNIKARGSTNNAFNVTVVSPNGQPAAATNPDFLANTANAAIGASGASGAASGATAGYNSGATAGYNSGAAASYNSGAASGYNSGQALPADAMARFQAIAM